MQTEPQKEHLWLHKLLGEWTSEMSMSEETQEKSTGSETVRKLGDLWVLCEGRGEMPGGGTAHMLMTLGYDPRKKRYVGTWVGSMMTWMWIYEGSLDATQKVLTLSSEGPQFTPEGKIVDGKSAKYRDVIEFKSDNHRVLTSHVLGEDGKWNQFMTAHYRRKEPSAAKPKRETDHAIHYPG
ncbi:MAG TPA: DUF1579 domain-containing protein [Blastocatellia bacterium]|nr:DUF1579 domain-containing protein [Blastocatellia bacterium]